MMTRPRLIFIAQPPPEVLSALCTPVNRNGLETRLGSAMFAAHNWHQSLSDRYEDTPAIRERMLSAGERVSRASANACVLTLNRIRDQQGEVAIHWRFMAKGKPPHFYALLAAVHTALIKEHLNPGTERHTPHITISYWAPDRLGPTTMDPIHWTINEILLVVGGGHPYHYEVIGRWPLLPLPVDPASKQLSLF